MVHAACANRRAATPGSSTLAAMRSPRSTGPCRRAGAFASSMLAAAVLAGCASTESGPSWSDPRFAGQSLRGSTLLVVCEAENLAIKRQCQDRLSAELVAYGATPVIGEDGPGVANAGRQPLADVYLPAARERRARAIFSAAVAPATAKVDSGPSIGIGLGGFGGGRVGVGGGVGISLPVGGAKTEVGLGATGVLTDVASGRTMWTSSASAPSSSDTAAQMDKLARAVVEAAAKAGLF